MSYKVFVINPGSTSTKIALFEDENKVFETSVFHDTPDLAQYDSINAQLPYRLRVVLEIVKKNGIDLSDVDAIVGRGGGCVPAYSGVYEVSDLMIEDTVHSKSGLVHPSNLGVQLAKEMQKIYGGRIFAVDCPMTEEFQEVAHLSGIAGMYRRSHLHQLNLKATARVHCAKNGVRLEDGRYIIAHIDGGMSICAHDHGKAIDGNDGAGGDGPFTPTRPGSVSVYDFIDYLIRDIETRGIPGLTVEDLKKLRVNCAVSSGLAGYFGTSNADRIHELVEQGDEKACLVWEAMIYSICKTIGTMAVVLKGKVDGIVCGGGLLRFADIREGITDMCSWIAPVSFYPGEFEHESMAAGAIRVLKGEEEPKVYTGNAADVYSERLVRAFPDILDCYQ